MQIETGRPGQCLPIVSLLTTLMPRSTDLKRKACLSLEDSRRNFRPNNQDHGLILRPENEETLRDGHRSSLRDLRDAMRMEEDEFQRLLVRPMARDLTTSSRGLNIITGTSSGYSKRQ